MQTSASLTAMLTPLRAVSEKGYSTVEEVLGRQRKKVQPWVTSELLVLCDQRRQLKQQEYTSIESELENIKVSREVEKKMKAAKEEWTEEQCKNIEKGMVSGNRKGANNTLKFTDNCGVI